MNIIDEYDLLLMISKTMSVHMPSKEAMKLNVVKTIVECGIPNDVGFFLLIFMAWSECWTTLEIMEQIYMQLLFYEDYLSSADCYRNLGDSLLFW